MFVDEGPTLKRFRPRAQGRASQILKRTSHVHVYLDNALWYMQYSLTKDIPVSPGTYVLKAEFVANDHAPFNPRDWSDQVFFTVK